MTLKQFLQKMVTRLGLVEEADDAPWRVRQRACAEAEAAISVLKRQIVLLDIGCGGLSDPCWQKLVEASHAECIMIDLADDWSPGRSTPGPRKTRVRAALGNRNGPASVYITRHPACSSCLRPNQEVLSGYPVKHWFDVLSEEELVLTRYDTLSGEHGLPQPDVVKIDVQGFEHEVLEGMGHLLDRVICLEHESQFKSIYEGQQTFFELYPHLVKKGFALRHIVPQGPFEGEAVEINAFWSRRPANDGEARIVHMWETACGIPHSVPFEQVDAIQRAAHRFNDAEERLSS